MFRSKIVVTLRASILDPQGKAVEQGIHSMGYREARDVRVGKIIEMNLAVASREEAERITGKVCEKLLSNPVMEDFSFTVEEVQQLEHAHG